MGFILYFISYILNFILTPFVIVYTLLTKWNTDYYFKQIAIATDRKGNITCQYLFNDLLITNDGIKFGTPLETVSFVLAENYRNKTLTWFGSLICSILILFKDKAFNTI